jgi:hypothetical protein
MKTLEPGDLLHYIPEGSGHLLIGIVLAHHDEIAGLEEPNPFDHFIGGPGVSIFWQTSNKLVYWSDTGIEHEVNEGTMKVVAKSQET